MQNHRKQANRQKFEIVKPTAILTPPQSPVPAPSRMMEKRRSPVRRVRYLQLIRSVFSVADKPRRTLALVSLTPQGGTSTVIGGLGAEMAFFLGESVVAANTQDLQGLDSVNADRIIQRCTESRIANLWRLNSSAPPSLQPEKSTRAPQWQLVPCSDWQGQSVRALRDTFDYVLLDCPALSISSDVLILAPQVDGVVLVVEAERTTREQVQRACRQISMSGGEVLGFVLNKRKYLIPETVYKWF